MCIKIEIFKNSNNKEPYTEWLLSLDRNIRAKINARIARIRNSKNLGVYKSLNDDVFEIKIDLGPGYRIYFGFEKNVVLILLVGGDKGNQQRDINRAKKYWKEHLSALKGKK